MRPCRFISYRGLLQYISIIINISYISVSYTTIVVFTFGMKRRPRIAVEQKKYVSESITVNMTKNSLRVYKIIATITAPMEVMYTALMINLASSSPFTLILRVRNASKSAIN